MKIVSPFTDFYDDVPCKSKRPVYHRDTSYHNDCLRRYKKALLHSRIGGYKAFIFDLNIEPYRKDLTNHEYISATPHVLGIGGNMHYYVEYYNSVLEYSERIFDYNRLARFYKNDVMRRSFDVAQHYETAGYCKAQFGCVNFDLSINSYGQMFLIKEPVLSTIISTNFLTAENVYYTIQSFSENSKEGDAAYKATKPTNYFLTLKESK